MTELNLRILSQSTERNRNTSMEGARMYPLQDRSSILMDLSSTGLKVFNGKSWVGYLFLANDMEDAINMYSVTICTKSVAE